MNKQEKTIESEYELSLILHAYIFILFPFNNAYAPGHFFNSL